jgi:hypothetical protein
MKSTELRVVQGVGLEEEVEEAQIFLYSCQNAISKGSRNGFLVVTYGIRMRPWFSLT